MNSSALEQGTFRRYKMKKYFEMICLKKDGHVSHRGMYLFERIDKEGDTEQRIYLHPVHVNRGKGFVSLIDNLEQVRKILRSIKCTFTEGNDAPRGGRTGDYVVFYKSDFLKALQAAFGIEKGREIYRELRMFKEFSHEEMEVFAKIEDKIIRNMISYPYHAAFWIMQHEPENIKTSQVLFEKQFEAELTKNKD